MPHPGYDHTGQRFGKLVVVGIAGRDPAGQKTFRCHCDCGHDIVVRGSELRKPKPQQSCGCIPHPLKIDPNRPHKRCPDCNTVKPIGEFTCCKGAPDGHSPYCRPCACIRSKRTQHQPQRTRYMREKRRNDPSFRIASNMRGRARKVLQGRSKAGPTLQLLGCSPTELRAHLEALFQPGMMWENYGPHEGDGTTTWQIDHIKPCASFDLTDPEQQKTCFHYTNLQPLWSRDNLTKHAHTS